MLQDKFATEMHRDLILSEAAPPSPHFDRHLSHDPVHRLQALNLPVRAAQCELISLERTHEHHRLLQIRNAATNAAPCASRKR
jgi:hypothetical protein